MFWVRELKKKKKKNKKKKKKTQKKKKKFINPDTPGNSTSILVNPWPENSASFR